MRRQPAAEPSGAAAAPPPATQQPKSSRLGGVALAVALVAAALAGWALVRTNAGTASPATDQQIADAQARACDASKTVSSAVGLQTHGNLGDDPVAMQAVAANARLSMTTGSAYLMARLDPATPAALAAAVTSLADGLQDVAIHTMAGVSNEDPAQAARLTAAEQGSTQIAEMCK